MKAKRTATRRASATRSLRKAKRQMKSMAPSQKNGVSLRSTKADLLRTLIDPEGTSVERLVSLSRMTRAQLAEEVEAERRAALRRDRLPCPQGHKPGHPACNLMCFVVPITIETPFSTTLPKLPVHHPAHKWAVDELTPAPSPYEAWAQLVRSFYAQFAVPKRPWWERIPFGLGWWWRVPLGWFYNWRKRWTRSSD